MNNSIYFIGLLLLFGGCEQENESKVDDGLATVQEKEIPADDNGYTLKLSEIEEEIILNPESPNAYYKRAIYYKNRKKYKLAIEDINRSLKLTPDVVVLNYEKAEILYESCVYNQDVSLLDESKIYLNHTLSLDAENIKSLLLKAKILLFEKKTDESMKLVVNLMKINKTLPEPYFIKGMIYSFLGNLDLAISSYQTAIEMDPNYYDAYINLGLLLEIKMDHKALNYYNMALEIYPNSIEATRNKGLYYHFTGDYSNARICFYKVIELDSTFEEAYFNIGNSYLYAYTKDMNSYTKDTTLTNAFNYYQKAIQLNPFYVQAYYNLGILYEENGDKILAKEYYLKAIDLDNNYTPALDAVNSL